MRKFFVNIYKVSALEWNFIRRDKPLLIVLIGALIAYSLIYSVIYAPEIYTEVKVAVVDNDRTAESRKMIRSLNASPLIEKAATATSLEEAKEMFLRREVSGIIVIPSGFEKDIMSGIKANFAVYADGSYFLAYKQTFFGAIDAMLAENNNIETERFMLAGKSEKDATFLSEPLKLKAQFMFNRYSGYATFLIPSILILIIQQTLLIAIGMISGLWSERKLYREKYFNGAIPKFSVTEIIGGKTLLYVGIELLLFFYIIFIEYKLFNFPFRADSLDLFIFILPYLLACIFLGITLSPLFRYRETSIITFFATSIPLIMLTGISWSEQAIPKALILFGDIIPSTPAVNGFVRMQTMGASFSDILPEYIHLWILCGIFFITSIFSIKVLLNRHSK